MRVMFNTNAGNQEMSFFFNALLASVLVYGTVTAIHTQETLWVIGYVATLITQILHMVNSHEKNNTTGGNKNDET